MTETAQARWTIEYGVLTLKSGERWRLPRFFNRMPDEIKRELACLPFDYFELGSAAADMKLERDAAFRQNTVLRNEIETLTQRLADFKKGADDIKELDPERRDRVLEILRDDMEVALNHLIRLGLALGIQRGGILYEEIRRLVEKYGMVMHTQTEYKYEDIVAPDLIPPELDAPKSPAQIGRGHDPYYD